MDRDGYIYSPSRYNQISRAGTIKNNYYEMGIGQISVQGGLQWALKINK